jgi:hypothetical protein
VGANCLRSSALVIALAFSMRKQVGLRRTRA